LPASVLFTGIFNAKFPKQRERYMPADATPLSADPKRYYTEEYERLTRKTIRSISLFNPDRSREPDQPFQYGVLIPELRSADKALEVITYPGEPDCFDLVIAY
jgi:hypothetical protein